MSWDAYEADDFVSADQYVVNTPGQLLLVYGQEAPYNQFHGGTHSFMMQLLVLSGLIIKFLLELVRL